MIFDVEANSGLPRLNPRPYSTWQGDSLGCVYAGERPTRQRACYRYARTEAVLHWPVRATARVEPVKLTSPTARTTSAPHASIRRLVGHLPRPHHERAVIVSRPACSYGLGRGRLGRTLSLCLRSTQSASGVRRFEKNVMLSGQLAVVSAHLFCNAI